jgi:EAL domain-containing protein (putative c-di-GMP-specific phosphodiesterase class I)
LFPVQTIKLDRSFIAQITDSERGQVFVGTIILLAHTLELTAVAEGVEAANQLKLLKAMRCDRGQGFHLGVPSLPERITEALDVHRVQRARRLSNEDRSQSVRA